MSVIAVIATLDTKGQEAKFLCDTLRSLGDEALLIDSGMGKAPSVKPDVDRERLFQLVNIPDYKSFLAEKGKAASQDAMRLGLGTALRELCNSGRVDGVISIGGAQGTAISTAAMQQLPIGFPKVMISTVASGSAQFGDYVGCRDIVMIPSIVDVCGLNRITVPIFTSGCAAVSGMARAAKGDFRRNSRGAIALTMAGVTTPCVMEVKSLLDEQGYETIVCHTNMIGSQVMDELAGQGRLKAVLDITTHEWGGYMFDGLMKCKSDRFAYIYSSDIPLISLPGCIDVLLKGPIETLTPELRDRAHYSHTPFHTHIRMSSEEMYALGRLIAEKHNLHRGKNAVVIPLHGFSMQNAEGKVLYDEQSNAAFARGVRENIKDSVMYIEGDYHINDSACAKEIVTLLGSFMEGEKND